MGKLILTNTRFFVDGVDLTGASNKVELGAEVEAKEVTTYGSQGWKEFIGGLGGSEWKASGWWEAGDPSLVDDSTWSNLGGIDTVTVVPDGGGNVGDVAYLAQALTSAYTLLGDVGEVAPWQAELSGSWPLARGLVAHPPGTARAASGTGTAQQLGAVAAGKALYASLHVLSVAGSGPPTITGRVESDDNAGFTSPTTRLTFGAATAAGGQILRTDGSAITDDWWRVAWTVSGSGLSFLFASALGIR